MDGPNEKKNSTLGGVFGSNGLNVVGGLACPYDTLGGIEITERPAQPPDIRHQPIHQSHRLSW